MTEVLHGALSIDPPLDRSVVTVGTFDGVHRGHQALVEAALDRAGGLDRADARRRPVVAYTFHPHPATLFAPRAPKTLMPLDRRVAALRTAGADRVLVEPFDRAFAAVDADDWVRRYLVERLRPSHVVIGFNFTYGRGRGGNPDHLRKKGTEHGFDVVVVDPVMVAGRVASSSEVRRAVEAGDVGLARELLGRPFAVIGEVVSGDGRGRTIGFPTANIAPEHEQLPARGVYASWLELLEGPRRGDRLRSVTNVGVRPTFDGEAVRVETHALDETPDLYGVRVAVHLLERIREERSFPGPDALSAQIARDVARARAVLEASR